MCDTYRRFHLVHLGPGEGQLLRPVAAIRSKVHQHHVILAIAHHIKVDYADRDKEKKRFGMGKWVDQVKGGEMGDLQSFNGKRHLMCSR